MIEIPVGTFYSVYNVFFTVVIKHDIINDVVYFFTTNNDDTYNMGFLPTDEFLSKKTKNLSLEGVSLALLEHYTVKYKNSNIRNSNLYDILIMNINNIKLEDI